LDEVSGGFLTAESVAVPKIIKFKDELTKSGWPTDGVMKVEYRSISTNETRLVLGTEHKTSRKTVAMKYNCLKEYGEVKENTSIY